MRLVTTALLLVVFIIEGCGSLYESTRPVDYNRERLKEINSTLEKRPSSIRMKDGHATAASSIFITQDSTFWHDSADRLGIPISNDRIDRVLYIDHVRGGVDGLTVGVGVGLTIFIGGVFAGELFDKSGYSAYTFLLAGIAAVPIGLIVGSHIGHSDYFVYPRDSLTLQEDSRVPESHEQDN
jgi:hypothetical protein